MVFRAAAQQDVGPTEILDLTKRVVQRDPGGVGFGWMRGVAPLAEGEKPLQLPFAVTIVQSTPRVGEVSIGDMITCNVELTNSGKMPVIIPWSGDENLRPSTLAQAELVGYRDASIAFYLMDHPGEYHLVASQALNGLPSSPGSLRTVRPGETVGVHTTFRVWLQERDYRAVVAGASHEGAVAMRLVASFELYPYLRGYSGNAILARFITRPTQVPRQ